MMLRIIELLLTTATVILLSGYTGAQGSGANGPCWRCIEGGSYKKIYNVVDQLRFLRRRKRQVAAVSVFDKLFTPVGLSSTTIAPVADNISRDTADAASTTQRTTTSTDPPAQSPSTTTTTTTTIQPTTTKATTSTTTTTTTTSTTNSTTIAQQNTTTNSTTTAQQTTTTKGSTTTTASPTTTTSTTPWPTKPATSTEPPQPANALGCRTNIKSATKPTTVHTLKPGDFDVVAAMGDSGTAANGALATSIFGLLIKYRGRAFSIGGDLTYGDGVITLPNILKEFNPNIKGFSTGTGDQNPNMNVGAAGATVQNMKYQALELVRRMNNDPTIDMDNDWKIVTLFAGVNNLCDYCEDVNYHSATAYRESLREALDVLQANMTKTLVNVVEVFDINPLTVQAGNNFLCQLIVSTVCPCAFGEGRNRNALTALSKGYQRELENLVASGRYDGDPEFTVVVQPFFRHTTPPKKNNGAPDLSYFSPDCFHFSAKGHNAAGKALWNTMLKPISSKPTEWGLHESVACPQTEFIPTRGNNL